jgi:long-chain acyl-CoA synthetase
MNSLLEEMVAACCQGSMPVVTDSSGTWSGDQMRNRIEHWLERFETLDSRRVAWQLPNSGEWIAIDLALLISGRIAVPVPDFFTPDQVHHVIESAGIDTWIGLPGSHPAAFERTPAREALSLASRTLCTPPAVHTGTAKITFTSGSTGAARGVCLSRDKILRTAAVLQRRFSDDNIRSHLCVLPLSLLLENVAGVYANLLNRSRLRVPMLTDIGMTGSSTLDIPRFIKAQHDALPQSIILVPQLLLALLGARQQGLALPKSYRFIAVGGARVAPHLLHLAQAAGLPVHEGYGLSECGSVVALNMPNASRPGSVGRPLDHVDISIRDGEIHVAGASMLGYLGGSAAPAILPTGDLGHFDADGYLFIDGRRKNCFITSYGRNVNPEWVESELTAQPEIALASVFGEALPGNIAVIVPRTTDLSAVTRAVNAANARLPDYARVAQWNIADPEEFRNAGCLTSTGKVRRDKVADAYARPLETCTSRLSSESPTTGSSHVL